MIRLALPTGDLRSDTAAALDTANLGIPDYASGSRALRFDMLGGAALARVFREKDIPVQVALGNYDAGICSAVWVEELTQRFPGHDLVRLRDLPFGAQSLWLAAGGETAEPSVRIVSEYPNIAATLARRMRLRRYRIFGVWGAAEAYPPEDADLALIGAPDATAVERAGLTPIIEALRAPACVVANRRSLATRDLSTVLSRLLTLGTPASRPALRAPSSLALREVDAAPRDSLRVALPDGHAQSHTYAALESASLQIAGYGEKESVRRPSIQIDGIEVKVIRPQDMPQQVAIGQFDLAVTGRDWLYDHLVQFPSSPVEEVVDLKRSQYSLAAIVKDVRAETLAGALSEWRVARPGKPVRIASEYPNIADHLARERHFGRYSVIPIAGASEGFVPDDAEILIEGIDTGSSVRANKLTVLERFFESTNIVIARKGGPAPALRPRFDALVERLRAGAAEPVAAGGA